MILDRVITRSSNAGANGGVPYHGKRIQAGLSTQIIIMVQDEIGNNYPVGAIQTMNFTESRTIGKIEEVGTDGIIQKLPTSSTDYKGSLERLVFDFQRLPQALQRSYRHLKAQRRPFDIVVRDFNPYILAGGGTLPDPNWQAEGAPTELPSYYDTILVNVWLSNINQTFTKDNFTIVERCDFEFEDIYDTAAPVVITSDVDDIETKAGTSMRTSVMSQADRVPR